MQGPTTPGGIETDQPLRRGFADNYGIDSPFPDEMMQPDRSLRPHWREFVSLLDELKPGEFRQRRELARRLIHQNGVTHNVYGDPNGLDRPWSLDFIPLLIPAAQWDSSQRRVDPARAAAGPVAGGPVRPGGNGFQRRASSGIAVGQSRLSAPVPWNPAAAGPLAASCTPPTWCATRTGSSKFSATARRRPRARAIRWRIGSSFRARCLPCSANATCSASRRFSFRCGKRWRNSLRPITKIRASFCSPRALTTKRISNIPSWRGTSATRSCRETI